MLLFFILVVFLFFLLNRTEEKRLAYEAEKLQALETVVNDYCDYILENEAARTEVIECPTEDDPEPVSIENNVIQLSNYRKSA